VQVFALIVELLIVSGPLATMPPAVAPLLPLIVELLMLPLP